MENYTKGETEEVEDVYPFDVDDAVQMRITQGSKIRNVMGFAMKKMAEKETRQITWNGCGSSVTKTITCAEIMKRKLKVLHQITKVRFKRTVEHWSPHVEGLEPLKVNRDVPAISILLSKDPLDSSEPGYQPPGNFAAFWQDKTKSDKQGTRRPRSSKKPGAPMDQADQRHRRPKRNKKPQGASNADQNKREETPLTAMDTASKES
eukprot:GHVL01003234.1.p1 GENE.GHVL01003234.1~~GHVL01003234.1.p1  ORF type:complete len:206 (-),score=23.53 GHVL01003234.1:602-1219(-)